MRGNPFNLPYTLTDDVEFRHSNEVLTGIFKMLSREGLDNVRHHNPIEQGDLDKLKTTRTIGIHSPVALQRLVWLNIAMHFARRGREGYRNMSRDSYRVSVDGDGRKYIEHTFCEKTKNHQGAKATDSYMPQGRIYEIEGDDHCPVRAYELYLSLLNPELDALWQKPNCNWLKTGIWYVKHPVGVNTLSSIMKSMCKEAQLTNIYTNHCTRVTASVILNEDGFNETDIIKVTGHKSTNSLKNYNHRATTSKKREMSDAINKKICNKIAKKDNENNQITNSDPSIAVIQCNYLNELDDSEMCNVMSNYETKNKNNLDGMFSNCVFNNATFNININN